MPAVEGSPLSGDPGNEVPGVLAPPCQQAAGPWGASLRLPALETQIEVWQENSGGPGPGSLQCPVLTLMPTEARSVPGRVCMPSPNTPFYNHFIEISLTGRMYSSAISESW